jgi:hypothetical protein
MRSALAVSTLCLLLAAAWSRSGFAAPEEAAPPAAPAAPIDAAADHAPLTMDEIPVSSSNTRVVLDLFGDTAFQIDSQHVQRPAFVLGPLDILLLGQFAGLSAMTEMALETKDGAVAIDLERLFVRWRGDRFTIDAGRTHTELGYWNSAFHHGRWLQTSVDRPRAVRFEDDGGTLPIHWVGVTGRWRLLTGARQLELTGGMGNGRGKVVDDIHVADDTNLFKSLLLKLEARGFGARDLRVGISGIYDRIAPAPVVDRPALPDVTINEIIGNAYAAYRGPALTLITEAFEIVHAAAGRQWATFDAFVLAGYRFGRWAPYVMGEIRRGDIASDPYFFPSPDAASPPLARFLELSLGVRWEVNVWSAVKVEYRVTALDGPEDDLQRGTIDWTFGF